MSSKKIRSLGMNTSSSHICPSSSSYRLDNGATNGLSSRAAILRHSVVTPGAPTGTMNVARCAPISMPVWLPLMNTSSA